MEHKETYHVKNGAPQAETPQPQAKMRVPCEVYTRIVGYLRPVQMWNDGKQQEYADRKTFAIPESIS